MLITTSHLGDEREWPAGEQEVVAMCLTILPRLSPRDSEENLIKVASKLAFETGLSRIQI
jgi:hypothetical protein